jgi:hypothetical protein
VQQGSTLADFQGGSTATLKICQVLHTFIQNDFLNEGHTVEICKLSILDNLANWLTRETAMLEVIDKVLSKCTKAAPPTAKQFEAVVKEYNAVAVLSVWKLRRIFKWEIFPT